MARSRLKGCTHTEFQACARYLLGISSRHISVVTRQIVPPSIPRATLPPSQLLTPPSPSRARARSLDARRYFICKEPCLQVAASSYLVCTGISLRGTKRHGMARHGTTRHGTARHSAAWRAAISCRSKGVLFRISLSFASSLSFRPSVRVSLLFIYPVVSLIFFLSVSLLHPRTDG